MPTAPSTAETHCIVEASFDRAPIGVAVVLLGTPLLKPGRTFPVRVKHPDGSIRDSTATRELPRRVVPQSAERWSILVAALSSSEVPVGSVIMFEP